MCSFHAKSCENPKPKKKSKSKIQRDCKRMRKFFKKELGDKELSVFTCSKQDESAKQHIIKLKVSNRNFIKEIAELKAEILNWIL